MNKRVLLTIDVNENLIGLTPGQKTVHVFYEHKWLRLRLK